MQNSTIEQQNTPTEKAKRSAYGKQWRLNNKQYYKKYGIDNKAKLTARGKQWVSNNKAKISTDYKQWYINNKQYHKQYRVDNKSKIAVRRKQRLKTDLLFSIRCKFRSLVSGAFKRIGQNKPARTEQLLGCSWLEAKAHFERLFQEGMSWENHGEWHIDHIRPVASFKLDELHLMNHISNLQPLWAVNNLSVKKVNDNIKWQL